LLMMAVRSLDKGIDNGAECGWVQVGGGDGIPDRLGRQSPQWDVKLDRHVGGPRVGGVACTKLPGYASGGVVLVDGDGDGLAEKLWLRKGDVATRTRDPDRGCAVGRGFVGGIDRPGGHPSIAVIKGAVVKFAIPAVFGDVRGVGTFEGSELFNRKVFRELFDGEVGKIVRHLMCFSSAGCLPFMLLTLVADCSLLVDW